MSGVPEHIGKLDDPQVDPGFPGVDELFLDNDFRPRV
jgi:hypothetical protein